MASGRLFVVATPIGNLDDISARALHVLRTVALIAAEDTRRSKRLLAHYDVNTPMTSYHEYNESAKTKSLLAELGAGRDVALITDSGTPCISDPGYRIVRAAHQAGVSVVSVPGPSAPIAALAGSGLPTDRFTFHGFFPRKRGMVDKFLSRISAEGGTHIFLESPNRLVAALESIAAVLPQAEACVARELTKVHEEFVHGTPRALAERYTEAPPRGECIVLIHTPPSESPAQALSPERLRERVELLMSGESLSRRDAIRQVAVELGVPRNTVYAAAEGKS